MQDDKEKFIVLPVPIDLYDKSLGGYGRNRDLTFITHNHYGNGMMPNNNQQMQMMAMQQALLATQSLLIEQKNISRALIQGTKQLLDDRNVDSVKAIEDKNENKIVKDVPIDASYEILEDNQQKNDNKTNTKENKMNERITRNDFIKNIEKSIEKQIGSVDEPPYFLKGNVFGTKEDTMIVAPVIFTIRNDIWRDRVRYIMKEYFYDNNANTLKREKNQENNNMAVVIFYNSKKEPIELIVIYQISLEEYLKGVDNKVFNHINIIDKFIRTVVREYTLGLDKYFIIYEPAIDNDKVPFVLNVSNDQMLADLIKIKPVLSFGKKEQRISVNTFIRFTQCVAILG